MLSASTEFPQPGSYGFARLERHAELCRILSYIPAGSAGLVCGGDPAGEYLVSLPLVTDSSGTRRIGFDELIDATPLTIAEAKEQRELEFELMRKRVMHRAEKHARLAALRQRAIYAPMLERKLRDLAACQRGTVGSGGRATKSWAA